jgi:CheY-like chemotaxis protein
MPSGGRLRITAENVEIAPGAVHGFHGEIPAGRFVRLSVADTGTGIPPEVLEKIFDPFFTTKEVGRGTGLGLSTIAGIVQNHEGALQVESKLGEGTTFHIYLPALPPSTVAPKTAAAKKFPHGRGELILIIDDDEGIRMVSETILSTHDYRVLTAPDGRTGLEEFRRRASEIQLVICDLTMPGMNGSEVLTQLHQEAPAVKLIAMSGMVEELSDANRLDQSYVTMLPKPLKTDALLGAVREVLDSSGVERGI